MIKPKSAHVWGGGEPQKMGSLLMVGIGGQGGSAVEFRGKNHTHRGESAEAHTSANY